MLQASNVNREYNERGECRSLADIADELRLELGNARSVVIENRDDPEYRANLSKRMRASRGEPEPTTTLPDVKEWKARMKPMLDTIVEHRKAQAVREELEMRQREIDLFRMVM